MEIIGKISNKCIRQGNDTKNLRQEFFNLESNVCAILESYNNEFFFSPLKTEVFDKIKIKDAGH